MLSRHSVLWPSLVVSDLPQMFSESFLKKFETPEYPSSGWSAINLSTSICKSSGDAQSPLTLSFRISRGHSGEELTLVTVKEDENKNNSKPQSKS